MDVFALRDELVEDYPDYRQNFIKISDNRIKAAEFAGQTLLSTCSRWLCPANACRITCRSSGFRFAKD